MKICMLRTLYLQSIPQFSARNISVWNRHRSDRLVQNSYFSLVLRHQLSTIQTQKLKTSRLLCVNNTNYSQTWKRQKSKRDSKRSSYEEDSEDDSEEDKFKEAEDDEIFQKYKHYEGDNIATSEPTHRVVHVSSTRVDAVLTKAFGIARAKIEEKLIAQNCLVNGKLLKKKSYQAKVGDCIDLIKEKTDSHNSVQRIRVLDIMEGNSKSGNTKVMIRLWKKAFPVEIS